MKHTAATRLEIEYGIARGWDDDRIIAHTGASPRGVAAVRRALDELNAADAFDVQGGRRSRDKCHRGHRFTPENTYHRPNSNGRECMTCRLDRQRGRTRTQSRQVAA